MKSKLLIFFIFSCFWICSECHQEKSFAGSLKNYSALVDPISILMRDAFSISCAEINLVSPEKFRGETSDFKDQLLTNVLSKDVAIFRQDSTKKLRKNDSRKRRCSVFVIRTIEDFQEVHKLLSPEFYKFNGVFLVVLVDGEIEEIEKIFKLLWSLQIHRVLLAHETRNGTIAFKTFLPFNSRKCHDTTHVLVDEYENGHFKNSIKSMLPTTMSNLHNCSIRAATSHGSKPFIFADLQPDGSYKLYGREISLATTLAETLNFYLNYTFIGGRGTLLSNGTAVGAPKALMDNVADIALLNFLLKEYRLKYLDATTSIGSESIVFAVPLGRDFSPFEKIIFPFSSSLWLWIVVSFLCGVLVIFIVNLRSKVVRNFVIGVNTGSPYFNMFSAFIGTPQNILPRTNFARFLLTMFLMLSLVIRVAYQGSFYKLVKSNERYKEVETIDEMTENDFNFYITQSLIEFFVTSASIKSRVVEISSAEETFYLDKLGNDSRFKGAVGMQQIKALYNSFDRNVDTTPRYKICKDIIMMTPVAIYTRKDFFLMEIMNEKIEMMKSAGLIDFWQFQHFDKNLLNVKTSKAPKLLNLNQLSGVFMILAIGFFISLIGFVLELMASFIKTLCTKISGYLRGL